VPGMRFSLRLNNDLALADYVALARTAEAVGFDQLWVSNDLFLRSAPVILAAVAHATHRIELGTGILNPHTIHPAELAMLAATMDELTGGRFNLGLGAGAADFLRWVGLVDAHPIRTMRETIDGVRRLLGGQALAAEGGRFLRGSGEAYLRFVPPRRTPIYLGAMGPQLLGLAGELADGALPLLLPPEHYFTVRALIEAGMARRDAARGPLDLAACVWVSVAEDGAAARRALAEKVAYYGQALGDLIHARLGVTREAFAPITRVAMVERDLARAASMVTDQMLAVGVAGAPEAVVERLLPLVRAGAGHVSLGPPLGPDPVRAVELLGRRVLPRLV
jgi:5,10-methylenetetrahydromethanopterin reductase